MSEATPVLLAADVGGTKTDVALFDAAHGPRAPLLARRYRSAAYADPESMLRTFLREADVPVAAACVAVAGPVIHGVARPTNLPWRVDRDALGRGLEIARFDLLNDLEAIAWAIPTLEPEDTLTLHEGEPEPTGALAVVAPGTGLGEAFLTWDGTAYRAHASEGGHADFAPADELQVGLLEYVRARYGHVSIERVCSGIGIPNIYDYLRDSGRYAESPAVAKRLADAADRTPVIVEAALEPAGGCPLCVETVHTFVAILGAEAGNLALKTLATGGIHIAGGIPLHMLPALQGGRLLEAFQSKGRMTELLKRIPVRVVKRRAALLGAAAYGLARLGS
ncbi:MAG TPA: glucokinase [Longimicrobiales bacterium]|nr:glucokinase [Longimicrobiales bacterium]